MPYQQISATITREHSDLISDELTAQAALAVTLASANSEEVFQLKDERPLWEKTIIKALFADDWPIEITMQELKKKFPDISWELEAIADEDWVRKTQENFPAQNFANKLWVLSSWEDVNEFPGQKIRIDPGLAFGTGTHDTTKLCLEFLANNAPVNKTVIDYGCGSGILALGALALGAKKVDAIDHDAQALEATRNNAQLNELRDGSLEIFHDSGQKIQPADLVIANILAGPLKELAPRITSLCKKDLILSGILKTEAQTIIDFYSKNMKFVQQYSTDEWVLLHFEK